MNSTIYTLYTLLIVSTLTVMSGATIAPALPAMQQHFSDVASIEFWVRLVLTVPALFIVIGAPIAGSFIDRYSKKKFLLGCMVIYALAGASGLFLDTLAGILVGRAILGLSVAGIMTTVITLFADYYEGPERARALGMQSSFMALGGVIFLTLGGFLADVSWRMPFVIYLASLFFLILAGKYLYDPDNDRSPNTEREEESIINNTSLLKLLVFVYGLMFLGQIIFYTIPIHLPFYLKNLLDATGTESGLAIALVTLAAGLTSFLYGDVQAKIGYVYIMALSFGLIGAGYGIISQAAGYVILSTGLVFIGIGFGLFMPNVNTWMAEVAPQKFRGRVMGGITTFVFLGQFLSPIATQPLNNLWSIDGLYLFSGMFLTGLAVLILLFRTRLLALAKHNSTTQPASVIMEQR